MGALDASDLLEDTKVVLKACMVVTPEIKVDSFVHVAELTADERDELETLWDEKKREFGSEDNIGFRAWVVAYCLCDSKRKRMFTDPEAIKTASSKLGNRPSKAISRIFNAACRLNGLLKSDIDELEKNSGAKPAGSTAGNGESPLASDTPAGEPGSKPSRRKTTPNS